MQTYLSQASKGDREDMGEHCFDSDEFRRFRYRIQDIEVTSADIKGYRHQMKYTCPKGVIISFEEKILYLIDRTIKKEQRKESFFPAVQTKCMDSEELMERRARIRENLPWDSIHIKSVARAVRFDPEHDEYVSKHNIVYVELDMSSETALRCRNIGGSGEIAIVAQSNLKQYVPKDRWSHFQHDITEKLEQFGKTNKDILNPEIKTKDTKRLRGAYDNLLRYYGNPKNAVENDPISLESPSSPDKRRSSENETGGNVGDDVDMDAMEISSDEEL